MICDRLVKYKHDIHNVQEILLIVEVYALAQLNPNTIKSYKILQNYLQNTQHMVLRNHPTLSIGTERLAYKSKQLPWRAALDPRLARGKSRVPTPCPVGALRSLFFSTLPSFLLREIVFFRTFPTKPMKVLGLLM